MVGWSLPLVVIGVTTTALAPFVDPGTLALVATAVLVVAARAHRVGGPSAVAGSPHRPPRGPRAAGVAHRALVWPGRCGRALCHRARSAGDHAGSTVGGRVGGRACTGHPDCRGDGAAARPAVAVHTTRVACSRRRHWARSPSVAWIVATTLATDASRSALATVLPTGAAVLVFAIGWPTTDLADRVSGRSTAPAPDKDQDHEHASEHAVAEVTPTPEQPEPPRSHQWAEARRVAPPNLEFRRREKPV